jgi:CRP/FNR family transcriptional regulator
VVPKMVRRLARRVPLTKRELQFLATVSDRTLKVRRRELVQIAGEPADRAYFLESGWAMTFSDFPDGSRQSRRLHFAGDILGLPSMAMRHHAENVEAITDVVVAPFPKSMVATLIEDYPRLAAIMFIFAQEERITAGDRLCSISRLSCRGRVAFLLMDLLTRLRAADADVTDTFEMHLTREEMGEITGMTSVHASRIWSDLIAQGAFRYERPFVTIEDEPRLISISNYVNRSADLDFTWLPAAGPSEARLTGAPALLPA